MMLHLTKGRDQTWNISFFVLLFSLIGVKILFLLSRYHFPLWDQSVYIGMGKYLWSFGTVGLWESIRPIGLPLVLGFFWKIGLGTFLVYDLVMLGFVLGLVYMLYLVTVHLFDSRVAFFSCLFLVLTPSFFYESLTFMTAIPSAFFLLLCLYLYLTSRSLFLCGICASLAFIFRFPSGLVLVVFLFVLGIERLNLATKLSRLALFFGGFLLVLLPYFVLNYVLYIGDTSSLFDALFRPWILGSSHATNLNYAVSSPILNVVYYPYFLVKEFPFFLFFFLGFFVLLLSRFPLALHLLFASLLLYFTVIVNKQLRFAVLFLPLLALYAAYGFCVFFDFLQTIRSHSLRFFLIFTFVLAVLVSFSIGIFGNVSAFNSFERTEPAIVSEYYHALSPSQGMVLTTDPVFASYQDALFIPYYNNVSIALSTYDEKKDLAVFFIYDPAFYPCTDSFCHVAKQELFDKLLFEQHLVFNQTYYGTPRFIFQSSSLSP